MRLTLLIALWLCVNVVSGERVRVRARARGGIGSYEERLRPGRVDGEVRVSKRAVDSDSVALCV